MEMVSDSLTFYFCTRVKQIELYGRTCFFICPSVLPLLSNLVSIIGF
jgi:hypothetical protein